MGKCQVDSLTFYNLAISAVLRTWLKLYLIIDLIFPSVNLNTELLLRINNFRKGELILGIVIFLYPDLNNNIR
jgi:hypothetical protein